MNKEKLLIIGFVWPEPKSSAAGSRMMQLIAFFLNRDFQITFASACAKSENAFDLSELGIVHKSIKLNCCSFDDFIKNLNPDYVLFDRFMTEEQFGWRVAENCPDAIKLLDTEDLHGLRRGRQQAIKDQQDFHLNYLYNDTAIREIASIHRCDLSLIISEAEMNILITQFRVDEDLLCYLPFMLDKIENSAIKALAKFSERQHFITIGNFLHPPNYDAVLYLKQEIWPIIKKQLPNTELHVYGAYASEKVKQLNNYKEGFIIKGFAENVSEVMREARVCLAPLRFGAGLKGKLVDAMNNGTPCVMTSIASEAMFGNMPPNGFITDEPEGFARQAIELYCNESQWFEFQINGFNIINSRFSKDIYHENFQTQLAELKQNLHDRRMGNFIGQMLQHHTMQSTKYMARWIEEKNK